MDVEAESGLPVKPEPGEAATIIATTALRMTSIMTSTTTTTTTTATTPVLPPSSPLSTSAASAASASTDGCVICLDAIAEPCVAQPCGHRHFDFLCLISWLLQRNPSCPLCKAVVATVQYGDNLAKTFPVPRQAEEHSETAASESVSNNTPSSSGIPSSSAPSRPRPFRRPRPPPSSSSSSSSPSPVVALERRRRVYRLGLYARHVGANRHSRYYRELTPQLFAQDPDLVSRARAFLRRELQVFWEGEANNTLRPMSNPSGRPARRANNVEFLLEYIVAILQSIDLQDSAGQAEELLQGFFRGRRDQTRHLLHELRSFLRSPYLTLASWDRHVQYGPPSRFPGEDVEEAGEEDDKHAPRPMMRGDYWRPSRRHRGTGRRATVASSSTSRLFLEEACRRYDPS